jgi:hypothetical protein
LVLLALLLARQLVVVLLVVVVLAVSPVFPWLRFVRQVEMALLPVACLAVVRMEVVVIPWVLVMPDPCLQPP